MIEPNDVVQSKIATNTGNPPIESPLLKHTPLVQRVSPLLPRGRKVVRRHARDAYGSALVVQFKEITMGPDIRAVIADKDGDIAQYFDFAFGAVSTQSSPLFAEEELDHLLDREFATGLVQERSHGICVSKGIFPGPLIPACITEASSQHREHRIVGQP